MLVELSTSDHWNLPTQFVDLWHARSASSNLGLKVMSTYNVNVLCTSNFKITKTAKKFMVSPNCVMDLLGWRVTWVRSHNPKTVGSFTHILVHFLGFSKASKHTARLVVSAVRARNELTICSRAWEPRLKVQLFCCSVVQSPCDMK